jgi:alkaline phosphatase D
MTVFEAMGGLDFGRAELNRRHLLVGGGATLLAGALAPRRAWSALGQVRADPFTLGVASGDPATDGVVLWTRLAPDPINGGGMGASPVEVAWEVASDPSFASVAAAGTANAEQALAHSVHVVVDGLEPDGTYWYRFSAMGFDSPVGRTRTAPTADCSSSLLLASASCQRYAEGYYTPYPHLVADEPDLVTFCGDYIYEGGDTGPVRSHNGGEIVTLDDYRNRYGLYKGDADLQAAHAIAPWLVTWDDHEVDNNYNSGGDAAFLARRAAAYQAWWEHQPVRLPPPIGPDLRMHRIVRWGNLASFFILDTRQYRDPQACGGGIQNNCAETQDPTRTILGDAQEAWLLDNLATDATWSVLTQQVVMADMKVLEIVNTDQWDGYQPSRQRVIDALAADDVRNPVVLTGDVHFSAATRLRQEFRRGEPDVAVELVAPGIASGFPPERADLIQNAFSGRDWFDFIETRHRGYIRSRFTHDELVADFRLVETVTEPTSAISTAFSLTVPALGEACVDPVSTTTTTSTSEPAPTLSPAVATPAEPVVASPAFTG